MRLILSLSFQLILYSICDVYYKPLSLLGSHVCAWAKRRQHNQVSGLFGNYDCYEFLPVSEEPDTSKPGR